MRAQNQGRVGTRPPLRVAEAHGDLDDVRMSHITVYKSDQSDPEAAFSGRALQVLGSSDGQICSVWGGESGIEVQA